MQLTGRIKHALEQRKGISERSGKSWMKQEFVIETEERYPRRMKFSVFGEEKLREMNLAEGDVVTISFDIDASQYNGTWYNEITAWKAEHSVKKPSPAPTTAPLVAPADPADDTPF